MRGLIFIASFIARDRKMKYKMQSNMMDISGTRYLAKLKGVLSAV